MKFKLLQSKLKFARVLGLAVVATGMVVYISSCKKSSTSAATDTTAITESDAAELTTDAVLPSSGGIVSQTSNSLSLYSNAKLVCGATKDSVITKTSGSSAIPAYSYTLNWNYIVSCDGLVPSQLVFTYTGNGTFDGLRMSSTHTATGGFTLTGLKTTDPVYLMNLSYTRKGTAISKIGNKNTFNSTIQIASTNITVDKTTDEIASGTATVSITTISSSGKTYSFNGNITFSGSKKAVIVLNSGASYNVSWL